MITDATQATPSRTDVVMAPVRNMMPNTMHDPPYGARAPLQLGDRRRTIVALVSASVISLTVWGLIVALHVH
jgi:hypothetical protein